MVEQSTRSKRKKSEKLRPTKPTLDTPTDQVQFTLGSLSGTGPGKTIKNLSDSLFHTRSSPVALYDTLLDRNSDTNNPFDPDSLLHTYAASYREKLENEVEAKLKTHLQKVQPQLQNPLVNTLSKSTNTPLTGASLPNLSLTDHYFKQVSNWVVSAQIPDQVLNGPLVDIKEPHYWTF